MAQVTVQALVNKVGVANLLNFGDVATVERDELVDQKIAAGKLAIVDAPKKGKPAPVPEASEPPAV